MLTHLSNCAMISAEQYTISETFITKQPLYNSTGIDFERRYGKHASVWVFHLLHDYPHPLHETQALLILSIQPQLALVLKSHLISRSIPFIIHTKELTYKNSICVKCMLNSSKNLVETILRRKRKSKVGIHQFICFKIKSFK